MAASLEIYVEADCFVCARSSEIAAGVRATFADVEVEMIDLADGGGRHRHLLIAAPTYVLDGEVVSLGNPDPHTLHLEIRQRQGAER